MENQIYFTITAKEENTEFEIVATSNDKKGYIKLVPGIIRSYDGSSSHKPIQDTYFYFKYRNNSGISNATIDILNTNIPLSKATVMRYQNLSSEGEALKLGSEMEVQQNGDGSVNKFHLKLEKPGYYVLNFKIFEKRVNMRLSYDNLNSLLVNSKETIVFRKGVPHIYQISIQSSGLWKYSFLSCQKGFRIYANYNNTPIFSDMQLEGEINQPASEFTQTRYLDGEVSNIYLKVVYDGEIKNKGKDDSKFDSETMEYATVLFNSNFDSFGSKYYNSGVDIAEQVLGSGVFFDGFSNRTKEIFFNIEYPSIASTILRNYPNATILKLILKYKVEQSNTMDYFYNFQDRYNQNKLNKTEFCKDISLLEFNQGDAVITYILSSNGKRFVPSYIKYSGGSYESIREKGRQNGDIWQNSFFVDRIATSGFKKFNETSQYKLTINKKLVITEFDVEIGEYFLKPEKVYFTPSFYYRTNETQKGGYKNKNDNSGSGESFFSNLITGLIYGVLVGLVLVFFVWAFFKCKEEISGRRGIRGEFKRPRDWGNDETAEGRDIENTGIELA